MNKFRLNMSRKSSVKGYLFILPWLIGFSFFYVYCLILNVRFSLSELSVGSGSGYEAAFVGLKNFVYAFRAHATFKQVLTTSVGDILIDVPLIIFFSLFVAMLLNRKFKGRGIVRAIFFLPVILNAGAIVDTMEMSAKMMTGGLSSVSQEVSSSMGSYVNLGYYYELFENLAIPGVVLDYLVGAVSRISDIITASGVQIIIFIAALQTIPDALYEVSRIEGATAYETFWKVTFPMVMPHIITNVVYTMVVGFAQSDVVNLAYTTAFTEFNYGLSSAFVLSSTVIVCALLALAVAFIQRRTFYYN